MDLRGSGGETGSVIFGGVDTKKYAGSLVKIPIIPASQSPDGYTRFWVYVEAISVNKPDGTVVSAYEKPEGGRGHAFHVSSGSTLSALPTAIFNKLVAAFESAQYVSSADLYLVDCDIGNAPTGSVDFTLGGKVIRVPFSDFIWHSPDSNLCMLGAYEDSMCIFHNGPHQRRDFND